MSQRYTNNHSRKKWRKRERNLLRPSGTHRLIFIFRERRTQKEPLTLKTINKKTMNKNVRYILFEFWVRAQKDWEFELRRRAAATVIV